MTDIEIAQSVQPKTITEIAANIGISEDDIELYGKYKAKLDLSEFMLLCREQGYFNLDEIQAAILEHNGKLSILPKAANRPATPEDLNIAVKKARIGIEVIMDGRIMGENLSRMGRNEKWLEKQLQAQDYKNASEIFLGIYEKEEDKLILYPNV